MKKYEVEIVKNTIYLYTAEDESEEDFLKKAQINCDNGPDHLDEYPEIDYITDYVSIGSSVRISDIECETQEDRVFRVGLYNR